MKYSIEITQHTEIGTLEQKMIYGADADKICNTMGITKDKDWQGKEYVFMNIPTKKRIDVVVYKQSVDDIDLGQIILLINNPKKKEQA
jgi:hypothetical protein